MEEKLIITKWNQNQFFKLFCCRDSALNITCLCAFILRLRSSFFFLSRVFLSFYRSTELRIFLPLQEKWFGIATQKRAKKRLKGARALATIEQISNASWRYLSTCIIVSWHPTQEQSQRISTVFAFHCTKIALYLVRTRANVDIYFTFGIKSEIITCNDFANQSTARGC